MSCKFSRASDWVHLRNSLALAKQLKKGEWVDVPITQEPQVEALKKALG